jgi:hypothetical protein
MFDDGIKVSESAIVVEAALGPRKEAMQRRGAVAIVGRRAAWKSSMPTSLAVCIGHPGSLKSGGT